MKILSPENPKITFDRVEIFADHEKNNRSGHLGHAMVECKDGSILAFYPNCSALFPETFPGHNMYGWVEYRRSKDRGLTWDEPKVLQYSYDTFIGGVNKVGCEKAVVCDDGTIVLFCHRSIGQYFEPYDVPVCLLSYDNGETWSDPVLMGSERGRIYDTLYNDRKIYVLELCNPAEKNFEVRDEGIYYKLFISEDNGKTYSHLSTPEFNDIGHTYGKLLLREDNSLIFYSYNEDDKYNLTALISYDMGKTWGKDFKVPVKKICRNPQINLLNGYYIMHGRSENMSDFVFYYSKDGIHWDDGTIVNDMLDGKPRKGCYYSNNIIIKGDDGISRMLVQYSETYLNGTGKFTIMHAWVECE